MTRTTRLHQTIAIARRTVLVENDRQLKAWSSGLERRTIESIDAGCQRRIDSARDQISRLERLAKTHGCMKTDSRWTLGYADDLAMALSFPMTLGMVA